MSAWVGFQMLGAMYPNKELNSVVGPVIIYTIMGFVIGKLIMNVFGLAVDTVLQCFIADEELNNGVHGDHTPPEFKQFLDEPAYQEEQKKNAKPEGGAQA